MMHAARDKPTRVQERRPSSGGGAGGWVGGGPGVVRARSGRRWMRVIALHFCKLFSQTRELFIRALDLFVGVREPFIGARDQGIVGFGFFRIRRGVHWRFPFPSNVIRRWRSTIAPWNRAGHCRRRSGSPLRFHSAGRRRTQFIPPRSGRVRARAANEVADRARGKLFSGALRLDGVPNPGRHIRPAEVGNRADARR